jgi:large subunit ribosomal protein L30
MATLRITLRRSLIGNTQRQRDNVRSLGLKKIRQSVVHQDSPFIRGMIAKVQHLVEVEEVPS